MYNACDPTHTATGTTQAFKVRRERLASHWSVATHGGSMKSGAKAKPSLRAAAAKSRAKSKLNPKGSTASLASIAQQMSGRPELYKPQLSSQQLSKLMAKANILKKKHKPVHPTPTLPRVHSLVLSSYPTGILALLRCASASLSSGAVPVLAPVPVGVLR